VAYKICTNEELVDYLIHEIWKITVNVICWSNGCQNGTLLDIILLYIIIILCIITNMGDSVSLGYPNPRRELKIQWTAEYFWQNLRCLDSQWNTILSVWYVFSIKSKTEEQNREVKSSKSIYFCFLQSCDFLHLNLMNYYKWVWELFIKLPVEKKQALTKGVKGIP